MFTNEVHTRFHWLSQLLFNNCLLMRHSRFSLTQSISSFSKQRVSQAELAKQIGTGSANICKSSINTLSQIYDFTTFINFPELFWKMSVSASQITLTHRIFIENLTSFQESQHNRNFFFKYWNSICRSQIETDCQKKGSNYKNEWDHIYTDGTIEKDRVVYTAISHVSFDIKTCMDLVVSDHFKDF